MSIKQKKTEEKPRVDKDRRSSHTLPPPKYFIKGKRKQMLKEKMPGQLACG